jgi:AraC family transcriptional regulator of arabinose operon
MMNDLLKASNYLELSLQECGKEQCIPDKMFHFTTKTYHLFHYVVSGRGTFVLNNIEYSLKEGMIFYIPPGAHPVYYPDHSNPWTYIWLGFSGSNAKYYLDTIGCDERSPIIIDKNRLLYEYFNDIYNDYRLKGYLDLDCLGIAYQLFNAMIAIKKDNHESKDISSKESYVMAAKEFIQNNYEFAIKIEDIAKNVQVSPNYLANVFKATEKKSPKEYLTDIRMKKAELLLSSCRYKVKDVGEMVGYKNQLHFSNEFKKRYGLSPLNYMFKCKGGRDDEKK